PSSSRKILPSTSPKGTDISFDVEAKEDTTNEKDENANDPNKKNKRALPRNLMTGPTSPQPKPPRKPSTLSRVIKAVPQTIPPKKASSPRSGAVQTNSDKQERGVATALQNKSILVFFIVFFFCFVLLLLSHLSEYIWTNTHTHIFDILICFALLCKAIAIGQCARLDDSRKAVLHASCFCKDIEYELLQFPEDIQHCYCSMCRKMHGIRCPFMFSYICIHILAENNIRWTKGLHSLKSFSSSEHGCRFFCGRCASNVALKYDFQNDTLWLTPALFDVESVSMTLMTEPWHESCRVLHIFCGSRTRWYPLPNDGQPQLDDSDLFVFDPNAQDDTDYPAINMEKPPDHITLQSSQIPAKPPPKNI
ncbi:hypothetical protein RFI_07707, partial [Reticulomyxa filosa]